jgi:hypothetical protein
MAKKTCPPSVKGTAFECPHCGAFTTQYWFRTHVIQLEEQSPLPFIPDAEWLKGIQEDEKVPDKVQAELAALFAKSATGLVFLAGAPDSAYGHRTHNLHISKCYNCGKIAVWVHDSMVFPHERQGPQPNEDLPEDVTKDFEEARSIIGLSPRGSAALLRLCIQKLCAFLGQNDKNLDDAIAALVKQGLNPLVKQSLDIVRVIGNEAVHPGVIDLNDNRDVANHLFTLVNSIADQMITHPKNVNLLYGMLPPEKRKAIEKRDSKS